MGRLWVHARKLFQDSHFKEYFGKPYDQLTRTERMDVWDNLRKPGPQEEDPRNRFAASAFFPGLGSYETVGITLTVLALRSIDSWYAEMRHRLEHLELEADPDPSRVVDAIEAQVRRMPQAFWPSEIAAIESRARQIRSEIGARAP